MVEKILTFTDSTNASFAGFPADATDAATNWGTVITTLFSGMSIPKTSTVILELCEPFFVSTFLTSLAAGAGAVGFNLGLDAYATELALLVVSAGFATVCVPPPPGTLLLELTLDTNTTDATVAAEKFAQRVREWAQTGTVTLGTAPGFWT